MSKPFKLNSAFKPSGDQPEAIRRLEEGLEDGLAHQTLLGVTGSGKTFTIANVIADLQRPTMVLAPNKTLAAQLYVYMYPTNTQVLHHHIYITGIFLPNLIPKWQAGKAHWPQSGREYSSVSYPSGT